MRNMKILSVVTPPSIYNIPVPTFTIWKYFLYSFYNTFTLLFRYFFNLLPNEGVSLRCSLTNYIFSITRLQQKALPWFQ